MIVSRVILKNWRNFRDASVALNNRVFLVGPNASGKSNFLDVFKFLRDIAKEEGGGIQKAVKDRGGLSKIRCLAARRSPNVEVEVHLSESIEQRPLWKYSIGIKQEPRGLRRPILAYEKVWHEKQLILDRPDELDEKDAERMTQTFLEQINANTKFRYIAKSFESFRYMHLVPQVLRYPNVFSTRILPDDPYGQDFLEKVTKTGERTRKARLNKIDSALQKVVPQFKQLTHIKDDMGKPHLEAVYEHWRAHGAKQREDQFSDGTLRLIGLFWSLLEGESLLLLEEPELSLNAEIIRKLPPLIHTIQKQRKRQVIISTHSADLLADIGIAAEEVLVLTPHTEGTKVEQASDIDEVVALIDAGMSVGEAILPRLRPKDLHQLTLAP